MRTEQIEASLERYGDHLKRSINTAIPGFIEDYDPETRTCTATPAISDYLESDGDDPVNFDWPPIPDCPVWYLGGGGFVAAPPLKKGDPCLIIFCQRPIDEWWNSNGQTKVVPALMDTHSESDAIVLAGYLCPQEAIFGEVSATHFRVIHQKGKVELDIDPSGEITITADTKVSVVAPRLNIGATDASKPLALTEKVDARISAVVSKVNDLVTGANAAVSAGGLWLTPQTPLSSQASVNSTKAFTND